MTKPWIALFFLASWRIGAQPVLAPPQLGFVDDNAHALRPVYGVTGNFILGPPVAGNIVSEAFSGSVGLLKTDSSLAAFDSRGKILASIDVTPGPALFAVSPGGNAALAYIASANALVAWSGSAFAHLPFHDEEAAPDTVLAVAYPTSLEASLMVQRNDTIWQIDVALGTAGIVSQSALAGVHAPLLALPSGDLVYRDAGGIAVRKTDGSEVHIAASVPASFSLQQMNRGWVQLTDLTSGARFAIHTAPGREGFYRLPE
jgi:hypothetical protein